MDLAQSKEELDAVTSFATKLSARVRAIDSLLCVGIDPVCEPDEIFSTCKSIIQKTLPFTVAYKFNMAFFLAAGPNGLCLLKALISEIPCDVITILDGKFNDIGHTTEAYVKLAFGTLQVDCVTVNPYLGSESILPYFCNVIDNKGVFVVCKTSNASSVELQDQLLRSGETIYEYVAELSLIWDKLNRAGNEDLMHGFIGVVVGGTDINALTKVRSRVGDRSWILCPGVGAQGGNLESICRHGMNSEGSGLLITISRSISESPDCGEAAKFFRDQINHFRALGPTKYTHQVDSNRHEYLTHLLSLGAIQFGEYSLKSGRISPYFFNSSALCSGEGLYKIGSMLSDIIHESGIEFDAFFGAAYKGIPLCSACSSAWYRKFGTSKGILYDRKEAKHHGEQGMISGSVTLLSKLSQCRVIIIDDVVTAGTAIRSLLQQVEVVNRMEAAISDSMPIIIPVGIVVILDREEKFQEDGTTTTLEALRNELNIPVLSLFKMQEITSSLTDEMLRTYSPYSDDQCISLLRCRIKEYMKTYGINR